jgi:hypothetical protein
MDPLLYVKVVSSHAWQGRFSPTQMPFQAPFLKHWVATMHDFFVMTKLMYRYNQLGLGAVSTNEAGEDNNFALLKMKDCRWSKGSVFLRSGSNPTACSTNKGHFWLPFDHQLECHSLRIYIDRRSPHQELPTFIRLPSTRSFILSMKEAKR